MFDTQVSPKTQQENNNSSNSNFDSFSSNVTQLARGRSDNVVYVAICAIFLGFALVIALPLAYLIIQNQTPQIQPQTTLPVPRGDRLDYNEVLRRSSGQKVTRSLPIAETRAKRKG